MIDVDTITPRDMRFNPPCFNVSDVALQVKADYRLQGQWSVLAGERDQNFRLVTDDDRKFVVKIAGPDEDPDATDFQVQALLHLEQGSPHIPVPRIVRTLEGGCLTEMIDVTGVKHALRVVSYLDGIPYGEGDPPSCADLQKIGAFQGEVVNALRGFKHKASRHFMPWNLSNGIAVSKDLWASASDDIRKLAAPLLDRLRREVLPVLNAGPSQVIHNDAHPYNLIRADKVSMDVIGIIDFGDMVYAPIINDLAVTATTFQRRSKENLAVVESLLIGFHKAHPLTDAQVSILWDAIILRLLITVLLSDIKIEMGQGLDPDIITDRVEAYSSLEIICKMDQSAVVNRLRAACGYKEK